MSYIGRPKGIQGVVVIASETKQAIEDCLVAALLAASEYLGFTSGARMRRVVDLRQVLKIEMGVNLRGGDVDVAEQFLNRAQIGTRFQHVSGEGVTQHVR